MKKSTCTKCGRIFQMGIDGICDPDRCDDCAGAVRDDSGDFWMPDEDEHKYLDEETGVVTTVSRKDAMK